MVIDGNTGQVLHAQAAEENRYPASLTKMMTLYIAFELMEQGRITPQSRIRISDEAAGTPPSKLGLPAGTEIAAGDAIRAIVTKSANDMSVALAEHIAGSETKFAILMTRKARQLGMNATTFRNAHGLPDGAQVTTARDMLTLALRLNDDFPKQYAYFGLRQFSYNGKTYRNHNTMLGTYPGMDGLKTGYTTASGFNLVASVRRNGKYVVAAVFGGSSASARNAHMRTILDRSLARASTEKTRTLVAEARADRGTRAERTAARAEQRARVAAAGGAGASSAGGAELVLPPSANNSPALIEPVRPAARPRAENGGAGTAAALISPAPQEAPRMPQRVAEAIRKTDGTPSPAVAADSPGTPVTAADTPRETSPEAVPPAVPLPAPRDVPAANPTPVEVYKVRPVMVAPRARAVASEPPLVAENTSPVRAAPSSLTRAPSGPPAAAYDPPPQAGSRMTFGAPTLVSAGAPPVSTAPAAPAAPAVSPPPAPAPVPASGRGMAPSSLQAQAARLNRGAEPRAPTPGPSQRTAIAMAPAGPGAAATTAYRLKGPEPASQPAPAAGIAIQVGAYASAAEARRQLDAVRARSAILARAQPSAEPVQTGGRQLFRARFTGLDAAAAATACTELRRQQIDCLVAK